MSSLYHYTSGDALLSILRSQQLWATDIRFLNDYEELYRGLEVFEHFSKGLVERMRGDVEHLSKLVEICVSNIRRNADLTLINLVSFSTEPDDLRQWMAYCNSGVGYCIEFDRDMLIPNRFSEFDNCLRLASVEYVGGDINSCRLESLAKFKDFLVDSLSGMDDCYSEDFLIEQFSLKVNRFLLESMFLAASIKPSEFSDEREVRLLYIGSNKESEISSHDMEGLREIYSKPDLPGIGFRVSSDLMIPYQPIPFNLDAIKRITIGPAANAQLAKIGVAEFRDRNELNFDIVPSSCTLRRF